MVTITVTAVDVVIPKEELLSNIRGPSKMYCGDAPRVTLRPCIVKGSSVWIHPSVALRQQSCLQRLRKRQEATLLTSLAETSASLSWRFCEKYPSRYMCIR